MFFFFTLVNVRTFYHGDIYIYSDNIYLYTYIYIFRFDDDSHVPSVAFLLALWPEALDVQVYKGQCSFVHLGRAEWTLIMCVHRYTYIYFNIICIVETMVQNGDLVT